jgi:hypothetical protein
MRPSPEGSATTAHGQRGRRGTWGERSRRVPSGDPVDARATRLRQADPLRPQRRTSRSAGIQPAKHSKGSRHDGHQLLQDALKDAAQGPLDSCTLCGAIINRSYEEAHNRFHQAFHQTAYQPLASDAPGTTVQTCRSAASLSTAPTSTPTTRSTTPTTSSLRPLTLAQLRPANSVASSSTGPTKTRTTAVTGSCRRPARRR